ncbi:MAG: spermidine/putrescine ABC transporter substrate-binding protein [Burkholderiales bacterium]|jgi:spermidine/putrescine transport system substrate-binding protein|nr:spermidine/putrescine ABC transporter substrate-binding protein [Burkholderiales bacterium]
MKRRTVVTVAAFAAAACLLPIAGAQAEDKLALYNWGDYINPEILTRFTKETGIKVTLDTYASNEEMLAKIQAGATGYDIVFPSVHMHDIMAKLGLLARTDANTLPGFANVDPAFLRAKSDPKGEWCVPYAWGTVGIVWNRKLVPEGIRSWKAFFDYAAKHPKKVAMLDDMRETLGVGLIVNGKSVNSRNPADIKLAQATVLAHKPNLAAFTYEVIPLVQSGDLAAAHYFVGAMMYVLEKPDQLGYAIPAEGATSYQEDICVLKSAPNKAAALKFIQFFLRPEVSVLNTIQQKNGSVNTKALALLPPAMRDNENINPPAAVRARLQIFEDLGPDLKLYDRAWTKVKTN